MMVSLMGPFLLSFFPLDVLDEISDLIESVSEGFLTYSYINLYWMVLVSLSLRFMINEMPLIVIL